jgi:hypothetical protein
MLIWNPWLDAVKFSFEVQNVIASRLLKIAAEGAGSSAERTRMVIENVKAAADAPVADAVAPPQGESIVQAADTVALAQGESITQTADAVALAKGDVAQAADALALPQGESIKTATKLPMALIKRRAHANHRRLKGK